MDKPPVYVSNCTVKSLWQKYEIFDDRLELHTWLGTVEIRFGRIEIVEVLPPTIKSLRLHLKKSQPFGLKLDGSAWSEHILLDTKDGFWRHILFTPEDPAEFKRVLEEAITQFRDKPQG